MSDTGRTLPEGEVSHVFEPFFTTKGEGGTGLGLSVSQQLVTSFGGTITAERRPLRGACFRVTLPASNEGRARPRLAAGTRAPRARVLLVDDEVRLTDVIAELLAPNEVVRCHGARTRRWPASRPPHE